VGDKVAGKMSFCVDNEVRLEQDSNYRHTDHQDTAVKEAKRRAATASNCLSVTKTVKFGHCQPIIALSESESFKV